MKTCSCRACTSISDRYESATTTANLSAYPVPIGGAPLRNTFSEPIAIVSRSAARRRRRQERQRRRGELPAW
jgi:hypothetical protein